MRVVSRSNIIYQDWSTKTVLITCMNDPRPKMRSVMKEEGRILYAYSMI
jgi:hypothetical protein